MVNVAVAGGTGGVGRTIIDALKGNPKHKAIILSRTVSLPDPSQELTFGQANSLRAGPRW